MVIEKKQFFGNRSLTHYVIPKGVKEIGDWAFACCRELVWVAFPESVEKIGREAFASCDKLKAVYYYRDSIERKETELADLLAVSLRFFDENSRLIVLRKEGRDVWLPAWDEACKTYIEKPDDLGYRPFWAGGEEDYEDENKAYMEYCRMTRYRKALVILKRLLVEGDDDRAYFLRKFRENDMALECLCGQIDRPFKVLKIYEESGSLTRENCLAVLDKLPRESVELRALLLLRTENAEEDDWEL